MPIKATTIEETENTEKPTYAEILKIHKYFNKKKFFNKINGFYQRIKLKAQINQEQKKIYLEN